MKPPSHEHSRTAPKGGDNVVPLRRRATSRSSSRIVEAELSLGRGLNSRLFELLAAIDRVGSINRAAGVAGLSYKGAWEMIERAGALSPRPLIERVAGGGEEKGTRLTETGRILLAAFLHLQQEKESFLDRVNEELIQDPVILQWFRRLFMKSSARNQWGGTVISVLQGAVNAEVSVGLKGGATLLASMTNESVKRLELGYDTPVIALVKASDVMLVTEMEGFRLSARNQLEGRVRELTQGPVTTEVVAELPGGDTVVASITAESCQSLGLEVGSPVTAVFKAGAIILGVAP